MTHSELVMRTMLHGWSVAARINAWECRQTYLVRRAAGKWFYCQVVDEWQLDGRVRPVLRSA